ncbi:hypothetical protein N665_0600s0038 [Sinapis alba]|nr:hypothetical protein N665_0600s0038 [Sinapis alba]
MAIIMKTLITFAFTILFLGSSVHCHTIATAVTPDNGYGESKIEVCFLVLSPCNWRYPNGEAMCNDGCRKDHRKYGYCNEHSECCCVY